MPVSYTIDADAKLIRTKCSGNLTLQEVLNHFRELRNDPACPDYLDVRLDLTEVTTLPESQQLRAVGYEIGRVREKVRFGLCAAIAPGDALFGMLRVFEAITEGFFRQLAVFRTAAEADAWLDSNRGSGTPPKTQS